MLREKTINSRGETQGFSCRVAAQFNGPQGGPQRKQISSFSVSALPSRRRLGRTATVATPQKSTPDQAKSR